MGVPLTLVGKQLHIPDVVESEFFRALGGQVTHTHHY